MGTTRRAPRALSTKSEVWRRGGDIGPLFRLYKEENDARTLTTRQRTHTRDDAARGAGALRHSGTVVRGTQQLASYTAPC